MLITNEDLVKLLIALIFGAILGVEREYKNKNAGFRTMILVCVGATLFTILSLKIGNIHNQDRIAANIITGIGFLGAGAIFRDGNSVSGLTTATTIWIAAALGMCVGAEHYLLGTLALFFVITVLWLFTYVQDYIHKAHQIRTYKITCTLNPENIAHIEKQIIDCRLSFDSSNKAKFAAELVGTWTVIGPLKHHKKLVTRLLEDNNIIAFEY